MSDSQTFEEYWKEQAADVSKILTDLALKRYNPLYTSMDTIISETADDMVKIYEIIELAYYRGQLKALAGVNKDLKKYG